MSFRAGTRSLLLGLAALLPSAPGCGARSDLAIGGQEACADGSRAGAVGCASIAFADPVSYPVSYPVGGGTGTSQVVVADLNGDGALDIAVTAAEGTVTVLLNRGDGVFFDGVPYPTSLPDVGGLAAGDLNRDGFVDLVVGSSSSAVVLLNDGHGAFAPGVLYAAGPAPMSVALGDLDGDGLLDIATANATADSVSVLSNLGDGTFAPPVTLGQAGRPISIAVADLNRDGRLDLAVTNSVDSGLRVFLNAGGGSFADPHRYPYPDSWIVALAVGDVSGDGWPDLVYSRLGDVDVLLGAGGGAFGDAASYPKAGISLALGDLNGDCRLDIAAVRGVLPNLGDGTFGPATAYPGKDLPMSVAVGDVDGDGKLDLVLSYVYRGEVSVLLNRGCAR